MDAKFKGLPEAGDKIVYVRAVAVSDLPEDLQEQAIGLDIVYSVHRDNGERVALVANRNLAFALARHHDMAPVNVH